MLRLDRRMSYKDKIKKVDEVLADLSLVKCQNTTIGVTGRIKGLSGGERKRLSFASEALTDPALLLCDEPTSGSLLLFFFMQTRNYDFFLCIFKNHQASIHSWHTMCCKCSRI